MFTLTGDPDGEEPYVSNPSGDGTNARGPMSGDYLLQVSGVSKEFPGVKALDQMHLELRKGEVLALVGENGAGKSTLMKLLAGVYTPDSGRFLLDGEEVEISGPKHAQELGVSIIHQEFNLMPDLTVAQNIYIGREPRWGDFLLSEKRLNEAASALFERLELPLDPRQKVSELTVAKQQMVEIAKALSYDARVLIMDEPTAALNDAEVAVLHDLIRRFRTPETGVIYISHRMDELKAISDRIEVIRDGRYIDTLTTSETTMREVISLMVGRELKENVRPETEHGTDEVVLAVRGLSTKELLHDVSFELHRGEILGFAGLMGAGRTEVARAIVGADRHSAGEIELKGTSVRLPNPSVAAANGIGYLSEDRKRFGLLLDQRVGFNVALSSLTKYVGLGVFMKDNAIRVTAREMVETLRIKTPSIDQTVQNLSGGNQQKVVIAKWLVKDCDVLIFDEPTRGIDVGAKEEIYQLLNRLAAEGKAIIMISSELPEVLRMSHRVAVMCEGRLTALLDADEADQESIMHYATLRPDVLGAVDETPEAEMQEAGTR